VCPVRLVKRVEVCHSLGSSGIVEDLVIVGEVVTYSSLSEGDRE
jgi:hypothetical protein